MAIGTTIAIVAGVAIGTCTLINAITYYATEDERLKAEIAQLEAANKSCDGVINAFNDLKDNLNDGKNYLNDAKQDFLNGGHNLDGEPLGKDEFKSCVEKIDDAINDINSIIADHQEQKNENNKLIREKKARLQEITS